MQQYHVLVIGSGIAGLTFALKCAKEFSQCKIAVLTKTNADETNTKYAQGGIAVVTDFKKDSYDKHIHDTLLAGDGLCDPDIVKMVVEEGSACVDEVIHWGTKFDTNVQGKLDLSKEGGHSENRVLHHKDATGNEIERTLLKQIATMSNITMLTHHFVIDLITQHHLGHQVTRVTSNIQCYGAYSLNLKTKKIERLLAGVTMLATGGVGQIYKNTTNPTIATGDGIAMLYRAKGRVRNMEFIQFHPTALYHNKDNPSFLITEALRGEGAVLRNHIGNDFVKEYDSRGSLAPRDIVARAIDSELKKSGREYVGLDATTISGSKWHAHFPNILEKCKSIGIDPLKLFIPVVPAAHYLCGGILTNCDAQTSIANLYACGECASTGLHGANRLASNSLLEGLVFANRAFLHLKNNKSLMQVENLPKIPQWNAKGTTEPHEFVLLTQSYKELKEIMSSYVGIVRSNERLQRALSRLQILYKETEALYETTTISPQLCELRNCICIAYLITRSAAMRHESRGLHYTTDYPNKKEILEQTVL